MHERNALVWNIMFAQICLKWRNNFCERLKFCLKEWFTQLVRGKCPGDNYLKDSYPGSNYPWDNHSGANCPVANFSRGNYLGGNYLEVIVRRKVILGGNWPRGGGSAGSKHGCSKHQCETFVAVLKGKFFTYQIFMWVSKLLCSALFCTCDLTSVDSFIHFLFS